MIMTMICILLFVKVMISNLDYSLTEDDVREFCSRAGPVTSVKIVKRRYAKTSKG